MKQTILIFIGFAVLILGSSAWAADQEQSFGGTWLLDSKNSDPYPHPIANLGAPGLGPGGQAGGMGGGMGGMGGGMGGMGGGMPGGGMGGGMPGGMGGGRGMGGGTPGGGMGRGPQVANQNVPLVIEQTGNEIKMTRTMTVNGKEMPFVETFKCDGSEQPATIPIPNSEPAKTLTTATLKKGKLQIRTVTEYPKSKSEAKREFSLSKDGKTLTMKSSATSPFGEMVQKQVYLKQE
jgi:hypothetical protein